VLVLIGIVLAIVPAAFILWPFVVGLRRDEFDYDEGAPQADLMRRWDAAASGLANAELDHGLGNMTDSDYTMVRGQLMSEAASVMHEMELADDEEELMLSALREEVRSVRSRVQPQREVTQI